ncbi:MAG TPA: hypothetical protein VFN71_13165 [Methylomirabilota bacterium]|nr:hypothetical protein [Methylomirabilota bacterium]
MTTRGRTLCVVVSLFLTVAPTALAQTVVTTPPPGGPAPPGLSPPFGPPLKGLQPPIPPGPDAVLQPVPPGLPPPPAFPRCDPSVLPAVLSVKPETCFPFNLGGFNAGTPVRQWHFPDQAFTLPIMVSQPGSLPPTWDQATTVLPGFSVIETTTGFIYPGMWVPVQVAVGGWQMQWRPQIFVRK